MTFQSDVAPLSRVLVKHASDAFVSPERIAEQWRSLEYIGPPDYDLACLESDAFAALLEGLGVGVEWMAAEDLGLDSIYVRDAALTSERGVILSRMGKELRSKEPAAVGRQIAAMGLPLVGGVDGTATLEGGDTLWLDERTLAVGLGRRTNQEGVRQLGALLPDDVELLAIDLPAYDAPGGVFHLMSVVSPLAEDLALVYAALLPTSLREALLTRGHRLVEVPDREFDTLGCNVLAVAPRLVVALEGNPETRRRMESVGVEVHAYRGREISRKGCGGPTCLTRPLER